MMRRKIYLIILHTPLIVSHIIVNIKIITVLKLINNLCYVFFQVSIFTFSPSKTFKNILYCTINAIKSHIVSTRMFCLQNDIV